jgi:hypothetical protein
MAIFKITATFSVFLLFMVGILFAQYPLDHKRDHIWIFGYNNGFPTGHTGGAVLDFNFPIPDIYYQPIEANLVFTYASTCDDDGNLLFYTNGQYVSDKTFHIMPGNDSLNPGAVFNGQYGFGYPILQGAIVLPLPGSQRYYYIIHNLANYGIIGSTAILYSIVDMSLNQNYGDLTEINIPLVTGDTLLDGSFSACRHANGRDWWLLYGSQNKNLFYRGLFDIEGMHLDGIQTIGENLDFVESQVCFSPDGSKYVIYGWNGECIPDTGPCQYALNIYDFDRCTGLLSNPQSHIFEFPNVYGYCAISPNSRYLYISQSNKIRQCDLEADDIFGSCEIVAELDGFVDNLLETWQYGPWFNAMQLAPDGKIYISGGACHYLHTIDNPDEPGTACNVNQHSVQLPTINGYTIGNFPNFRLGPLDGSSCDTLGIDNLPVAAFQPEADGQIAQEVTFNDQSTGIITTWLWDFGDGGTSMAQSPVYNYALPGIYTVCLTVSNGTGSDSTCQTIEVLPTGVTQVQETPTVRLYPNPVQDFLIVQFPTARFGYSLSLSDALGEVVLTSPLQSLITSVDMRGLVEGLYFYTIKDKEGRVVLTEKVVKYE